MRIILDTNNPKDNEILAKLFDFNFADAPAQPEVANNTGTVGSGFNTFSSADSSVSEPEVMQDAPVAPEKPKRVRKAKAETPETGELYGCGPATDLLPDLKLLNEKMKNVSEQGPGSGDSSEHKTSDKPLTEDDVRASLQGYVASRGLPAGMELLKKFGAGRISELKADKYDSFLSECAA